MNERTDEIAEQAGFVDKGNNITAYLNFDHEKFAELIVQECVKLVDSHDRKVDPDDLIHAIEKHFGVK